MSSTRDRMERVRATLPPGTLLLVRIGAFYEFHGADAETAARVLGRRMETRSGAPMCALPYHAQHAEIARLMSAGHKVAVMEPAEADREA